MEEPRPTADPLKPIHFAGQVWSAFLETAARCPAEIHLTTAGRDNQITITSALLEKRS